MATSENAKVAIDGAAGVVGSQILSGSGAPSNGLGADGDFYFNTANGDYYKKVTGAWVLQGNLTGPAGANGTSGTDGVASFQYFAYQFDLPNNSDWTVAVNAAPTQDSVNNALTTIAFDETTEEGVGFRAYIPSGKTNILFRLISKAVTAPGTAKQVRPKLYMRTINDNAAVSSWSSGTLMTPIDITTNAHRQYDTETISLSTLGLTAGTEVQFELTRLGSDSSDTLVGDWALEMLAMEFT